MDDMDQPLVNSVPSQTSFPPVAPNYSQSNGHIQPLSATHNVSLCAHHSTLQEFVDTVNSSIADTLSNDAYRYKEVHVLLMS